MLLPIQESLRAIQNFEQRMLLGVEVQLEIEPNVRIVKYISTFNLIFFRVCVYSNSVGHATVYIQCINT